MDNFQAFIYFSGSIFLTSLFLTPPPDPNEGPYVTSDGFQEFSKHMFEWMVDSWQKVPQDSFVTWHVLIFVFVPLDIY